MSGKVGTIGAAAAASKFKEAPRHSAWFVVIQNLQCHRVMRLLEEDPSLLQQTDDKGRSALHVVVLDSRADLVRKVLLMCDGQGRASSSSSAHQEDTAADSFTVRDLVEAVDASYNETAFGYALLRGNEKIAKTLLSAYHNSEIREDDTTRRQESDARERVQLRFIFKQLPKMLEQNSPSFYRLQHPDIPEFKSKLQWHILDILKYVIEENEGEEYLLHHLCYYFYINEIDQNIFSWWNEQLINDELVRAIVNQMKEEFINDELVRAVVDQVKEADNGPSLLRFLFNLRDCRGNTPLHALLQGRIQSVRLANILKLLLKSIPEDEVAAVNAEDSVGRTTLHIAATMKDFSLADTLAADERTDLNKSFTPFITHFYDRVWKALLPNYTKPEYCCFGELTALHLAVLNDAFDSLKSILKIKNSRLHLNLRAEGCVTLAGGKRESMYAIWTPLQMAAVMGNIQILELLLEDERAWDYGRIGTMHPEWLKEPALHLAAYSGNPQVVKLILDNPKFDHAVTYHGRSALHCAVAASIENDFQSIAYCGSIYSLDYAYNKRIPLQEKPINTRYSGKKGCINFLLQAGLNIWSRDDDGKYPTPDLSASEEDLSWWYEKVDSVTKDAKNNLTTATNAISVTAALVATASYVGPMQPPHGYQNDNMYIRYELLPVRMFMVCSSLSFYFAVASIVLSIIPSLPLPQEPLQSELQRIRRTVIVAVCLLFASIVFVLLSFSAATITVVPNEWSHRVLTFSTSMIGGIVCFLVLSLISLRLARLVFYKYQKVRHLYHRLVKF